MSESPQSFDPGPCARSENDKLSKMESKRDDGSAICDIDREKEELSVVTQIEEGVEKSPEPCADPKCFLIPSVESSFVANVEDRIAECSVDIDSENGQHDKESDGKTPNDFENKAGEMDPLEGCFVSSKVDVADGIAECSVDSDSENVVQKDREQQDKEPEGSNPNDFENKARKMDPLEVGYISSQVNVTDRIDECSVDISAENVLCSRDQDKGTEGSNPNDFENKEKEMDSLEVSYISSKATVAERIAECSVDTLSKNVVQQGSDHEEKTDGSNLINFENKAGERDSLQVGYVSSEVKSPEIFLADFENEKQYNLQATNLDGRDNSAVLPDGGETEQEMDLENKEDRAPMPEQKMDLENKEDRAPMPEQKMDLENESQLVGNEVISNLPERKEIEEQTAHTPEPEIETEKEPELANDEVVLNQPERKEIEAQSCQEDSSMDLNELEKTLKRFDFLVQQVHVTRDLTCASLERDYERFQKIFDEFMAKKLVTLQEIKDNAEKLVMSMESTLTQLPEIPKTKYLDQLEACFSNGYWLEKFVKPKQFALFKESLFDIFEMKYRGLATVKNINEQILLGDLGLPPTAPEPVICDPFLVNVTAVNSPGEFYITRVCDLSRLNMFLSTLKEAAPTYPVPPQIISGQTYAVRDTFGNWNRGICGKEAGHMLIGNAEETLYQFFFLDNGNSQHIPTSSIRTLPPEHLSYPPFALECTLNQNFQRVPWDTKDTNYFKQMTKRGPMSMKVFSKQANVLNVDLAQLPCFAEEGNIVSVRDALFFTRPTTPTVNLMPIPLKLVHEFRCPIVGNPEPQNHFRVCVSNAISPSTIYVRMVDEEAQNFQRLQENLQTELQNAENDPNARLQHICKGLVCATKFKGEWRRVFIEDIRLDLLDVFYVDSGYRQQKLHRSRCFSLPERLMDVPAQALRCKLHGIGQHESKKMPNKWPNDLKHVRNLNKKSGTIFIEHHIDGEVGRLSGQEFTVYIILYMDGASTCVNTTIMRKMYGSGHKQFEKPEHHKVLSASVAVRETSRTGGVTIEDNVTCFNEARSIGSISSGQNAISTDASNVARSSTPDSLVPIGGVRSRLNSNASIPSDKGTDECPDSDCTDSAGRRRRQITEGSLSSQFDGASSSCFGMSLEGQMNSVPAIPATSSDISPLPPPLKDTSSENLPTDDNPLVHVGANNNFGSNLKSHLCDVPSYGFRINPSLLAMPMEQNSVHQPRRNTRYFSDQSQLNDLTSKNVPQPSEEQSDRVVEDQLSKRDVGYQENDKFDGDSGASDDVVAVQGTQPLFDSETAIVVHFSWCKSPDAIYVRTSEMETKFKTLKIGMQQYYRKAFNITPIPADITVGFRCAVFTDKNWWRAEVICMDNYPKYGVYLVDIGYQRTVNLKKMSLLAPEFDGYPRLTMQCSLAGVYPPYLFWNYSVSHFITEKLLATESISIVRRGIEKPNGPVPVMLLYVCHMQEGPLQIGGKTRINLNEELISAEFASSDPAQVPIPKSVSKVYFWKPAELPKLGDKFWGNVTWVNRAGEICLHDIRSAPLLNEIGNWLDNAYNGTEPTESDLQCRKGDLCIAKYSDNRWHRAIVHKTDEKPEDEVDVIFVDYGTLDSVKRSNIRLNIMLEEIPLQGIWCTLHNIQPPVGESEWPLRILNSLHKRIVEKEHDVVVKGRGPPIEVTLTQRSKLKSIANFLVKSNKASYIEQPSKNKKQ